MIYRRSVLSLRVTPETKQRLLVYAEHRGTSLTSEVERLIELGIFFERLLALAEARAGISQPSKSQRAEAAE